METENIVFRYRLSTPDQEILSKLTEEICLLGYNNNYNDFFRALKLKSYLLPSSLIDLIYDIKYLEKFHVLAIGNLPVLSKKSMTPSSFEDIDYSSFQKDEIMFMLIASLVGDIFTWNTIQSGRIINHIFPIEANELKPISSSSKAVFGLHTEDAFHRYAGDYLMLMGYRNPNNIPTTVVYMEDLKIDDDIKLELFKRNFVIRHNIAHELSIKSEEAVSILFGHFDSPYIRINLNSGRTIGLTPEAVWALNALENQINNSKKFLNIHENEVVIFDNYRIMHGREEYVARYDGTDRYLKRLYVTRDIRKSRELRSVVSENIIQVEE